MKTLHKFILLGIAGLFFNNVLFAERLKDDKVEKTSNKLKSSKSINSGCAPGNGSTYLEINNVRALIHTGGDMWWDLQGYAKYEIPKGSGKMALFAGSIWIGGTDVNGQLKLAAMQFRQGGIDYWPGPLIINGGAQASVTTEICAAYDRHFVVSKAEVAQFRSWFNSTSDEQAANFPDYQIPEIITNWPAHGPAGGYDNYLAPFFDNNHDGLYNPADGDYPYFDLDNSLPCGTSRETRVPHLYGDQTLWWVFNDMGNLHTETDGTAIGLEIRAQAFAFATNDEFNNMTFYNYSLINRSAMTLFDTYVSVWTDADLGDAVDDYIGCDVNRGLGYIYNGKSIDGTGQPQAYGGPTPPPPSLGIDFFEGPYQDNDGIDNLTSWDNNDSLNCSNGYRLNLATGVKILIGPGDILNGNINGLNFGDSIVDNERWGMRKFVYYSNGTCSDVCQPGTPLEFFQYMKGYWKDGTRLIFGGIGHAASGTYADFMFPALSDPCNWGTAGIIPPAVTNPLLGWCEKGESNPPGDRRLLQSAGPFTLEPGAVNDVTTGAVWARANTGDEYESVKQMQLADDKAQKFFDNCFRNITGPDAPELNIIAQDQKLIFHIYNLPGSNNYLEQYNQKDPLIICPAGSGNCDKNYKFQGYQVFQLANQFVTASDLHDDSKARLVYQCDITDQVKKLVNYTWSDEMEANIPVMEVNGNNSGISHSFALTDDAFSTGDGKLVNNKKYFYIAIAYAYNDFLHYNQNDPATISGQKKPYLPSSKSYNFNGIKIYGLGNDSIIPYNDTTSNNLSSFNYAEGFEITQVEGHGNGNNSLELTDGTIAEIMAGAPWKALHPTYKAGMGPVKVKIIDPLNIPAEQYTLKFDTFSLSNSEWFNTIGDPSYGLIKSADWFVYNSAYDTIWSDQCIVHNDEKIIPGWGISITVQQVAFPLQAPFSPWADIRGHYPNYGYVQPADSLLGPLVNNGVIESSIENSDNTRQWLYFLPDKDGETQLNWIRSGSVKIATLPTPDPTWDDYFCDNVLDFTGTPVSVPWDANEAYENIISGGWAPYFLCQRTANSAGPGWDKTVYYNLFLDKNSGVMETGLTSVDIVITPDKTKWSRCPVIELCNDTNLAVGNAQQFTLRKSYSIDKNGIASNVDVDGNNPDDANYIGAKGMGWFPGYAIDTETGERLNIIYGEDSWFPGDNGADMIWNPSGNIWSLLGDPIFGGKHYIYVMGNPVNYKPRTSNMGTIPAVTDTLIFLPDPNDATKKWYLKNYDEGKFIYEYYKKYPKLIYPYNTTNRLKPGPVRIISTAMWVGIPMSTGLPLNDNTIPLTEIKVKIRVAKPYRKGYKAYAVDDALAQNNNFPMYTFGTANHRAPLANFSASATTLILSGNVNFFDNSQNSRNSWKWTFTGGNPSSSTLQNPINIYYNTLGTYDVKLVVHGAYGSDSITKTGYITVNPTSIEETILSQSVTIFPNPTDGKFTISYNCMGSEQMIITIYNTTGEVVINSEIKGKDNLFKQINLSSLSGGIYLIRIDTKKGSIYKKIIKN